MIARAGSLGLTDSMTSGTAFLVMDNYCKLLGIYGTNIVRCGAPFTLEANSLKYVLTLETAWADVGGASFKFSYANGEYVIHENGCTGFRVTGMELCSNVGVRSRLRGS